MANKDNLVINVPFHRRIRTALIAMLLVVTFVPILILQFQNLRILRQQARQQAQNQLESVVQLKEQQLHRWLNDSQTVLRILVVNPFFDAFQQLAINPDDTRAKESANRILNSLITPDQDQSSNLRFKRIFYFLPDGRVVASSDPRDIGKIVRTQNFFAKSLQNPWIEPPYYSAGTTDLTIISSYPLRNGTETQAVLAAELDLTVLGDLMLERSGLGTSGETYLVSLESNYLLTPSRFNNVQMQKAHHSQGIDAVLQQQNGSGIYLDYLDQEVLGVYRWIPDLQAGLIAEVHTAEAFSAVERSVRSSILLALAVFVGVLLLGVSSAWRITRQVSELEHGAQRVAGGDFSTPVKVFDPNELGLLAASFNRMASEIEIDRRTLEERVSERTAELEASYHQQQQTTSQLQMALRARDQLQETIRSLSMPVVPVLEGIIVMPLVGEIDTDRADAMKAALMHGIAAERAKVALIDVTGVPLIDTHIALSLVQMVDASALLGTHCVLVGIRPELAQTIIGLGLDLAEIDTRADLQSGVMYAMELSKTRYKPRLRA